MAEPDSTVLIHSDVWVREDGTARWMAHHPATGRKAWGTAADQDGAYAAIRSQVETWFPEAKIDKEVRLVREHYDG